MSPTSIFAPVSTSAESIFGLSEFVLTTMAMIFVVAFALLVYVTIKFRNKSRDDRSEPAQVYGSTQVELAWTVGHSTDFWTLSLLSSGIGCIGTAINLIATILCMRCPGMTLQKMPLLVWLNLVMAGLVILAVSPLSAAQLMLLVDRYLGGHFFDTKPADRQ